MKNDNIFAMLENRIKCQTIGSSLSLDNYMVSYGSFLEKSKHIGIQLKGLGINKGKKVAISLKNQIDYFGLVLGLNYSENVVIPIYPDMGKEKIQLIIKKYEIQYIICDWNYSDNEIGKISVVSSKEYKIYSLNFGDDSECEDVAIILFTSGTTNVPKAIMLTNYNIISNIKSISGYLNINCEDRLLLIKSIYHSSTIIGEFLVGMYNMCNLYFTSHIIMTKTIFHFIAQNRITVFFAVPTLLEGFGEKKLSGKYDLSSLRIVNYYGAKAVSEKIFLLMECFPKIEFIYSYGQTEASPRVTYIKREAFIKKNGSSGKAIDNVEVKICDDSDEELPCGQVGEIVISGPNVMKGYYKNVDLTKITLRNGKLHSGDLGYMDEENYLYVVGRKDNMFTSAGKNIYLEEIEDVVLQYPGIKEACAFVHSYVNGIAKIYLNICSKNVKENEIFMFLRERLENYKLPEKIFFVEHLEKTISGKIIRHNNFSE